MDMSSSGVKIEKKKKKKKRSKLLQKYTYIKSTLCYYRKN